MATRKRDKYYSNSLAKRLNVVRESIESLPLIAERWVVAEYTPASEDDYGSWVSDKYKVVALCNSEAEAQEFLDNYDPAPGTTFKVTHEYLREHKVLRWGPL